MKNIMKGLWLCLALVLLAGCESKDSATGSIAVRLVWPSPAELQARSGWGYNSRSGLPADATTVRVRIIAPDMNTLQKDFPASAHGGKIENVPAGSNRTLTVQSLDNTGSILASCEKDRLLIEAGKTTQAGDCVFQVVGNGGGTSKAIEPKMIALSAGCYDMGSPDTEEGRFPSEALHNVCVDAFSIGKYEVTRGEFSAFVEATDYKTDAEKNSGGKDGCYGEKENGEYGYVAGKSWKDPNYQQSDQDPVVCVSWQDATAYVEWLSGATGKNYRLPTEAEWEYAARAGTTTSYSYGSDLAKLCQYGNGLDQTYQQEVGDTVNATCDDGYNKTAPVGQYKANAWGLHDVHGNVWEWSCSKYASDYDGSEKECLSKNEASSSRVLRGGSWFNLLRNLRSATRGWNASYDRTSFAGFRLAQDL